LLYKPPVGQVKGWGDTLRVRTKTSMVRAYSG